MGGHQHKCRPSEIHSSIIYSSWNGEQIIWREQPQNSLLNLKSNKRQKSKAKSLPIYLLSPRRRRCFFHALPVSLSAPVASALPSGQDAQRTAALNVTKNRKDKLESVAEAKPTLTKGDKKSIQDKVSPVDFGIGTHFLAKVRAVRHNVSCNWICGGFVWCILSLGSDRALKCQKLIEIVFFSRVRA